jgi:hypothetical protein
MGCDGIDYSPLLELVDSLNSRYEVTILRPFQFSQLPYRSISPASVLFHKDHAKAMHAKRLVTPSIFFKCTYATKDGEVWIMIHERPSQEY